MEIIELWEVEFFFVHLSLKMVPNLHKGGNIKPHRLKQQHSNNYLLLKHFSIIQPLENTLQFEIFEKNPVILLYWFAAQHADAKNQTVFT